MKQTSISLKQAQCLFLASQKLIGPALEPIEIIEHLGYVQIDTLAVVERAHHHVFWSRNQKYQSDQLADLVSSRQVFEYWSHAASFLPMRDYRFSLPMKKAFQKREDSWFTRDRTLMRAIVKRIRDEGPMRSRDFKNDKHQTNSTWWGWKPAKKALEILFLEGQLEITQRDGFQKVYDLPERVIPRSVDTTMPTDREYARYLIGSTLRHHGLASASEMVYLRRGPIKKNVQDELQEMHAAGELVQVSVEGLDELYYAFSDALENIPNVTSKILILSPFDNLVIQRKKLAALFNYDYQIECYVPEAKRKYGYFCLPVFYGTAAVARIDCKADRQRRILLIQSSHYEDGIDAAKIKGKLDARLKSFAKFNQCESVEYA